MKCLGQFISVRLCCNETQAVGMTASDWPVSHVVKRSQTIDLNLASLLSFTEIAVSGLILRLMHQSTETPIPWVPGKGRGFDIDPGQKALISLPPKARVQIKRPYP